MCEVNTVFIDQYTQIMANRRALEAERTLTDEETVCPSHAVMGFVHQISIFKIFKQIISVLVAGVVLPHLIQSGLCCWSATKR